ncbi:major facilitator superfamily domain-containing protein [Phycomyces blakesleeanus]
MDRTNLSNAVSDNLAIDLGFTNDGVNTSIMIYSIVFALFALPSNAAVKHIGAHIWIPLLMNSWAIDFNGFIVIRIFIAITEAGFIPACLCYLTEWYKSNELSTRLAWFWGVQAFASAFSGLLSFGVLQMAGLGGLQGWKWLFLVDGIATHIVGIIAFMYLPASPERTSGWIRSREGWFNEREERIAMRRIVRDGLTKQEQEKPISKQDVILALKDTKLWIHLSIAFLGMMPSIPIHNYLPTIVKEAGFSATVANLLTAPAYLINLLFSILIARGAEKNGNVSLYSLAGSVWGLLGFLTLFYLPASTGRWSIYAATLFTASAPSWHGMHVAWMSSNLAPAGKRAIALGAIVGAANINGVPGAQIYQSNDAPRYRRGNGICIGLHLVAISLFLALRSRYTSANSLRGQKWELMTTEEKDVYNETSRDIGSDRLDFQFKL